MDRKRYQFSLYSLLALTTAWAVLLSLVKTFPDTFARALKIGLILAGPLMFILGSLLVLHSKLFFPGRLRVVHVYAPLAGLLCIITGLLLFFFLH